MKIQNIELAFVTFDAQDVIMTSVLTGYFRLDQLSYSKGIPGDRTDNVWTVGLGEYTLTIDNEAPFEDVYYKIVEHSVYTSTKESLNIMGAEKVGGETPTDGEIFSYITDIVAWLDEHGQQ